MLRESLANFPVGNSFHVFQLSMHAWVKDMEEDFVLIPNLKSQIDKYAKPSEASKSSETIAL